ncbi:MAG: hypothetical protein ACYC6C_05545 [Coriobacteriia bacterium]
MTHINLTNNASYNFKAPTIDADADSKVEVVFPTQEALVPETSAAIAVNINRQTTTIDLGELGAAGTLNATIGSDVERGAIVHVKALSDGTARDITFGTGFTAPVLAGVISKTKVQSFIYDGTTFLPMGAALQID